MTRVVVLPGGVAKTLVPVREWHFQFNWRDLRIGASFQKAMWEFNLPGFCVWCDRYHKHGETLPAIPEGAEIVAHPDARLSDLQAVGAEVRLIPR